MPSPLGHMLAGAAAGILINGPSTRAAIVVFAAAAAAPDTDLLFGVHRGASHSLGAAAIAGAAGWLLWRPLLPGGGAGGRLRFALAVALAYATHIATDLISDDTAPPIGLMALWPFTAEFYQSDLRVFLPINRRVWLARTWLENTRAVIRELLILVPPLWIAWWVRGRETR